MKIAIRKPLSFSEIGRKDNQEDYIYHFDKGLSSDDRFFILCDGMGGHEHGEVASKTVAEALGSYFAENKPSFGIATNDYFNAALQYAYDELDKEDTGGLKKMGTTMTCVYLHAKGCMVAHIGDSRIYLVRPSMVNNEAGVNGILYQSSDHSLVNDLLKIGELTPEEAENFPQKNVITRAMQPNQERRSKADVYQLSDIQGGDYLFMCCDGVLEQLTNSKLCSILADKSLDDKGKLDAIHKVCYDKTRDNFTCILIPIDSVEKDAVDAEIPDDSTNIIECSVFEPESKADGGDDHVAPVGEPPVAFGQKSISIPSVLSKILIAVAVVIAVATAIHFIFPKEKGATEEETPAAQTEGKQGQDNVEQTTPEEIEEKKEDNTIKQDADEEAEVIDGEKEEIVQDAKEPAEEFEETTEDVKKALDRAKADEPSKPQKSGKDTVKVNKQTAPKATSTKKSK